MWVRLALLLLVLPPDPTNSAYMKPGLIPSRITILPEELTPVERLRDPEGRFLGFYEDDDRNPDKFHFYYSMWEADEQRDTVIRRNNRHAGEDLSPEQVALLTNQDNRSHSVLLLLYILGLYSTWVPYAISVIIKAIRRRNSLRRLAAQRAAAAQARAMGPERPPPGQPPSPPPPPQELHVSSILHIRPDPAPGPNVDPDPKIQKVQFNLAKGLFRFGGKAKAVQMAAKNLVFGGNRVRPSGEQVGDDDSLSEDDAKQALGKSTEFRVQVEKLSETGWAESENEGDVDTAESGEEDEGSMWDAWKKLRQRSNKKPPKNNTEDFYAKYCTDTLW